MSQKRTDFKHIVGNSFPHTYLFPVYLRVILQGLEGAGFYRQLAERAKNNTSVNKAKYISHSEKREPAVSLTNLVKLITNQNLILARIE